jgi:LPS O-antigen subunit length determinant protein (WzzB/FepE family)
LIRCYFCLNNKFIIIFALQKWIIISKNFEFQMSKKNNEIDFLQFATIVWASGKLFVIVMLTFILFGVIYGLTSDEEFKSNTKFIANSATSSKGLGGLSSLAGIAGINVDISGENVIPAELYPEVVTSIDYQLELIHIKLQFTEYKDSLVSFYEFFNYIKKPSLPSLLVEYTIGLPGKIIRSIIGSNENETAKSVLSNGRIIQLSKLENNTLKLLRNRMTISVDEKSGIVEMTAKMPDAKASAILIQKGLDLLEKKLINYKVKKASERLDFIRERHDDAEARYLQCQIDLAKLSDANINISNESAKIKLQRAQNDFNLAFEVFKGLSTQLEQAEISVKEATPVLSIISPVYVPIERSEPKRAFILIVFFTLGFVFTTLFVLIKEPFLVFTRRFINVLKNT